MSKELAGNVSGNAEGSVTMAAATYGIHAIVASTTRNANTRAFISHRFMRYLSQQRHWAPDLPILTTIQPLKKKFLPR